MKFMCLIAAERVMETMSPEEADRHYEEYAGFIRTIRKSGHFVSANRLLPVTSARTLRVRQGRVKLTDGPFAETKEQIGGYFVIEAKDIDEALEVASGIPGGKIGCVEVRPVAEDDRTVKVLGS